MQVFGEDQSQDLSALPWKVQEGLNWTQQNTFEAVSKEENWDILKGIIGISGLKRII